MPYYKKVFQISIGLGSDLMLHQFCKIKDRNEATTKYVLAHSFLLITSILQLLAYLINI